MHLGRCIHAAFVAKSYCWVAVSDSPCMNSTILVQGNYLRVSLTTEVMLNCQGKASAVDVNVDHPYIYISTSWTLRNLEKLQPLEHPMGIAKNDEFDHTSGHNRNRGTCKR
jgi:hypothetical protein